MTLLDYDISALPSGSVSIFLFLYTYIILINEMKLNDEFMYIKPELIYDEFDGKCPSWEELKAL